MTFGLRVLPPGLAASAGVAENNRLMSSEVLREDTLWLDGYLTSV